MTDHRRHSIFQHLAHCVAVGVCALALSACKTGGQTSSSSHWVGCKQDVDCLTVPNASHCSEEGFCAGADEQRVRSSEGSSSVGVVAGSQSAACDPLAVQLDDFTDPIAFSTETEDGDLLIVTWSGDADHFRIFYGSAEQLVERVVTEARRDDPDVPVVIHFLVDGSPAVGTFVTPQIPLREIAQSTLELNGTTTKLQDVEPAPEDWTFLCIARDAAPSQDEPDASTPPSTPGCAPDRELSVCYVSPEATNETAPGAGSPVWTLDTTARVGGVGRGLPPTDDNPCPHSTDVLFGTYVQEDQVSQLQWLQLYGDDGQETFVSILAPQFRFPVTFNEEVHVRLRTERPEFSLPSQFLELRNADDELLLWVAEASAVEELTVPAELSVNLGASQCEMSDDCVSAWTQNGVEISASGESVAVPYGEIAPLGGWNVLNGGMEVQTGMSTCDDAFVALARLMVWKPNDAALQCPQAPERVSVIPAACTPNCADGTRAYGSACGCSCVPDDIATDTCSLPPDPGDCDATEERYYFDPDAGACETFQYGGCRGNWNNFSTRESCEELCVP